MTWMARDGCLVAKPVATVRWRWLWTAALLALAACASLDPNRITLTQADLQARLEREFPRQQRLMDLVDVSLSKPSLRLLPERNRMVTALDVAATERLAGQALRGTLAIEHTLRYEPADASVRLANVKVQDLRLALGGTALPGQVERLGGLIVQRLLDDFVIHRLGDDQRELLARAGVNNADVSITAQGVELRFTPPR